MSQNNDDDGRMDTDGGSKDGEDPAIQIIPHRVDVDVSTVISTFLASFSYMYMSVGREMQLPFKKYMDKRLHTDCLTL